VILQGVATSTRHRHADATISTLQLNEDVVDRMHIDDGVMSDNGEFLRSEVDVSVRQRCLFSFSFKQMDD
jgi:hypothetical protein